MVQGAHSQQQRVGVYGPGSGVGHVHDLQGVLESSGSLLFKLAQQFTGSISQFG